MDAKFRKDLASRPWAEVYTRQERRAPLVPAWLDALGVGPGARVLDVGAGPGFVSLAAAARVGPAGTVYAVDRSAEALAFLAARLEERGVANVERLVTDAAAMAPPAGGVDAALVTMVLHHADDPAGLLAHVARLVPVGGRVVVAEFHPDGPCREGPPREARLAPRLVRGWCRAAGLDVATARRQTPEHYMLVAERSPVPVACA